MKNKENILNYNQKTQNNLTATRRPWHMRHCNILQIDQFRPNLFSILIQYENIMVIIEYVLKVVLQYDLAGWLSWHLHVWTHSRYEKEKEHDFLIC